MAWVRRWPWVDLRLGAVSLLQAMAAEDVKVLCQAPGVGKRTAERLSLEWRSAAGALATAGGNHTAAPGGAGGGKPELRATWKPLAMDRKR